MIGEDRERFPHGAGKVIVISFIHSPTYSFIQEGSDQMPLTWGLADQWDLVPAPAVLAAVTSKSMVEPVLPYAFRGKHGTSTRRGGVVFYSLKGEDPEMLGQGAGRRRSGLGRVPWVAVLVSSQVLTGDNAERTSSSFLLPATLRRRPHGHPPLYGRGIKVGRLTPTPSPSPSPSPSPTSSLHEEGQMWPRLKCQGPEREARAQETSSALPEQTVRGQN